MFAVVLSHRLHVLVILYQVFNVFVTLCSMMEYAYAKYRLFGHRCSICNIWTENREYVANNINIESRVFATVFG